MKLAKIAIFVLATCLLLKHVPINPAPKNQAKSVYVELKRKAKNAHKKFGNIAICTLYTDDFKEIGNRTTAINKKYCDKFEYDFYVFREKISSRHPSWDKLKAISRILNKSDQEKYKYDYVMWIDADAYFNDLSTPIEVFLDNQHHFFACDDVCSAVINAGVFVFKNDKWSRKFIKLWWKNGNLSKFRLDKYYEQDVFDGMFRGDVLGITTKSKLYRAGTFNSIPYVVMNFKDGWDQTFIVHLMGLDNTTRANVLKQKVEMFYRENPKK